MSTGAAVRAVRFGLRCTLPRAIAPVMPRTASTGAPSTRAIGLAIAGPTSSTPANTRATPTPRSSASAPASTATIAAAPAPDDRDGGDHPAAHRPRALERRLDHRRDGRHPTGTDGRDRGGDERGGDAGDERDRHGRPGQLEATRREAVAERVEQLAHADRQADPAEQAEQRPDHADDEGLAEHRRRHLPAAGADGAQQRVLPLALGGGDREHVVDDEAADGEGDEGEHRQEDGHEAERLADLVLLLVGDLLAGQRLGHVGVERGLHPRGELGVGHRAVAARRARRRRTRGGRRTPRPSGRRTAPTCRCPVRRCRCRRRSRRS